MTQQPPVTERDRLPALVDLPEAPWVAEMRQHFAEHGFYRQSDLERLLGKPCQSVGIDENGKAVLRG